MIDSPCHGCGECAVGCHASCEQYAKWVEKMVLIQTNISVPHYMPPMPITHEERIQTAMLCTNIFPSQPLKSPVEKIIEALEWENSHGWLYRIIYWHENPKYRI